MLKGATLMKRYYKHMVCNVLWDDELTEQKLLETDLEEFDNDMRKLMEVSGIAIVLAIVVFDMGLCLPACSFDSDHANCGPLHSEERIHFSIALDNSEITV